MQRMSSKSVLVALPLALLATSGLGCGGGDSTDGGLTLTGKDGSPPATGGSGVTGSKTIANLTTADNMKICDWSASLYGGYGKSISCSANYTVEAPADQAECLARTATIPATCALTVAQAESCTKTIASCGDATTPECVAMLACLQ